MNVYFVQFGDDLKIEKYHHVFNLYDIAGYIAEISMYGYRLGEHYGTMYIDMKRTDLIFSARQLKQQIIPLIRNDKIEKII